MTNIPVLTAQQTRAAEQVVFDSGVPVIDLMEQAGAAVADAIIAQYNPAEALILCGPGNNGGDGYVVARRLKEAGWPVRIAAMDEPKTEAAIIARKRWNGPVEAFDEAPPATILIDALFGTGLTRGLDLSITQRLCALASAAEYSVAIDLPSGIETDSGNALSPLPHFNLTVALGVFKPAHMIEASKAYCGTVTLGDIGLIPIANAILAQPPTTAE